MINEGEVALTPLPQADGRVKNRPVLVLRRMPPFSDLLVCGISTQLQQAVVSFDELIDPADADFVASGLKAASLIRHGYLAVLPPRSFLGKMASSPMSVATDSCKTFVVICARERLSHSQVGPLL
jgi:mRNA interferase MazF